MRVARDSRMEEIDLQGRGSVLCPGLQTMSFISRFLWIPVLGLAAIARAGEMPRIVVVPFTAGEGAPDVAAGRFTSQVTEELRSHNDVVDVVGAPTVKAPAGGKTK